MVAAAFASAAHATTWTVGTAAEPATLASASCDASHNCPTLRDAINKAASGDTIVFARALDGQTITLNLFNNDLGSGQFGASAFYLRDKSITIDAASGMTSGIVLERNRFSTDPHADPSTPGPAFRLFDVGPGAGLTLIGLKLQHGLAQGGNSSFGGGGLGAGGAIFNQGTTSIQRCTFVDNSAIGGNAGSYLGGYYGGGGVAQNALSADGGGPKGGSAGTVGIGAWMDGNPGHFQESDGGKGGDGGFGGGGGKGGVGSPNGYHDGDGGKGGFGGGGGGMAGHDAKGGSGGFGGGAGGGIFNDSTTGIAGGFGGGNAYGGTGSGDGGGGAGLGGAIFNDGGQLTLVDSTFAGNTATGGQADVSQGQGSGYGGALFNYNGRVKASFTTFANNRVIGAAIAAAPGMPNAAHPGDANGGAIYSLGDSANWAGNTGVALSSSAQLVFNSSIAANSSGQTNDGTIAGMTDIVVKAINGGASTSSGESSLVMHATGFSGSGTLSADPQLDALIGGGGLAAVMKPQAGSPVVDNSGACSESQLLDQRGKVRPQGATCDIGAVELTVVPTLFSGEVTVTTADDKILLDGQCSLREAIAVVRGVRANADCPATSSNYNRILFDASLANATLTISDNYGPFELTSNVQVEIDASAAPGFKIDGAQKWQIASIAANADVAIVGIGLRNGSRGNPPNTDSGGCLVNDGNLVLYDTSFDRCSAKYRGGAIHNTTTGSLTIGNSLFSNNQADPLDPNPAADNSFGGAIYNEHALEIFTSQFTGSSANTAGGAIESRGSLQLSDSTFSDNTSFGGGGALDVASGSAKVEATTFDGNHGEVFYANPASIGGGAISIASGASMTLSDSTVSNSILYCNTNEVPICLGGGIASNGSLDVINSTLAGNSIQQISSSYPDAPAAGSALAVNGGATTLQWSTIAGNIDPHGNVSSSSLARQAGSLAVSDSIVANNGSMNCSGSITDAGGNLAHGDTTCTGFASGDPKLGVLADNGGPTKTMLPGAGSAALDQIVCTQDADQRGVARPQGNQCDIGAVEVVVAHTLTVSVTGNGSVSATAFLAPLSGGITGCTSSGGANCTARYDAHTAVALSASAATGWTFSGWGGDCLSLVDGTASVVLSEDRQCTAIFTQNPTATTTTATLSTSGAVFGQPVTLDIAVQPQADRPTPTGNVNVTVGAVTYAFALDANGHAAYVDDAVQPGTYAISVAYPGDAANLASGAAPLSLTVGKASTTTAIASATPASVALGASIDVAAIATAIAPSTADVSGTILVSDSDGNTCNIALGHAPHCAITPTTTGTKTITAHYLGDVDFNQSQSAAASVEVTPKQTYAVTTLAGAHGSVTPATQAVDSGQTATVAITPDSGYTATISGTCAGGALVGNTYTSGTIAADCAIVVLFSNAANPLSLLVSDGHDFIRYGQTARYLVMVGNSTANDISGLGLSAVASSALDGAVGTWCTVGGAAEAPTCTPTGSGPFSASAFTVPAHGVMLWQVSVPVLTQTPEFSADYTVRLGGPSLPAPISQTDSDTLVLFRDGFDHENGDGTGEAPIDAPQP
jgi:hypothetical protein